MNNAANLTVRLPLDLLDKLRILAKSQRRSMNSMVLTLIEKAPDPED